MLSDLEPLRRFIASEAPEQAAANNPLAASVFSFLAARVAEGISLATIPGLALDAAEIEGGSGWRSSRWSCRRRQLPATRE